MGWRGWWRRAAEVEERRGWGGDRSVGMRKDGVVAVVVRYGGRMPGGEAGA